MGAPINTVLKVGLTLLALRLGGLAGATAGVLAGLAYVEWANTSCSDGNCGYVVGFQLILGLLPVLTAGTYLGRRLRHLALLDRIDKWYRRWP
jgi:hypothetical protein